jgi:hypothetical protein
MAESALSSLKASKLFNNSLRLRAARIAKQLQRSAQMKMAKINENINGNNEKREKKSIEAKRNGNRNIENMA